MNGSKCVRASVLVAWLASQNSPKAMPGASACDFLPRCEMCPACSMLQVTEGPSGSFPLEKCGSNMFKQTYIILHTLGQSNMAMENARFIGWFSLIFRVFTPVGVDFPACHVWLTENTIRPFLFTTWDDSGSYHGTTAFQCCKPICGRL